MRTPYFSHKDLPFQTPGSTIDHHMNLTAAMQELRCYALYGGQWAEAMTALQFLEETRPELCSDCATRCE